MSGYIALETSIAVGATAVVVLEDPTYDEAVVIEKIKVFSASHRFNASFSDSFLRFSIVGLFIGKSCRLYRCIKEVVHISFCNISKLFYFIGNSERFFAHTVFSNLAGNAKQLEEYRNGNAKILQFFVGQVMKLTKGRANPPLVVAELKKQLGE